MCDKAVLDEITKRVCASAKEVLGEKLEKVVLFGSRARGDYDNESDIDIMVLADIKPQDTNNTRRKIRALTGDLGLEYDVLVSLHMICSTNFHEYIDVLPYYMNIVKDGIELHA
ncbi:MAG: nucleotidyltransferase domain-containing protein [Chitinispirillales bacterium]|nr:nucleotidyltransferase domain-containing protein [Chitinispirillales bacterium]